MYLSENHNENFCVKSYKNYKNYINYRTNSPNNKTMKYIYTSLSDDTNHDCVFTFCVVEDIILNHQEVIEQGILVLRSDNCIEQYKNRKTFYMMKLLAKK